MTPALFAALARRKSRAATEAARGALEALRTGNQEAFEAHRLALLMAQERAEFCVEKLREGGKC